MHAVRLALLLISPGCSTEDGGTRQPTLDTVATDTGPDIDTAEERWSIDPTSIDFNDVPIGQEDFHSVVVTNNSSAPWSINAISLLDTEPTVRFPLVYVREMATSYSWADTDGDAQAFDVRDTPIRLEPGGRFEITVVYQPNGNPSECLDPPPSACGVLAVTGEEAVVSVPLFVPREGRE